ncbi:MAG: phosphate ABC transporter permease subunit PstC [Bacteroidales bacterium]|nr:phosphate ABC transporter permease subunit PstC [Bacteroidales bacterium]
MTKARRIYEKIVTGILFSSSTITSLTVILIVVFLFREGIGLFNTTPTEKNYVIAVSRQNTVPVITSNELADIFNQDITNWKQLGGRNDSIIRLTLNDLSGIFTEEELGPNLENFPQKLNEYVKTTPGVILYLSKEYIPKNFAGRIIPVKKISLLDFIFGKHWYPTSTPIPQFGIWPMIVGTLMVTFGAILFALPFGMATAIFMSEIAGNRLRTIMKPVVELLAGIPSVVYGFFGLVVLVPLIQRLFGLDVGETVLAGSIVLGIMALPTMVTVAEDALNSTPKSLREASLALGASELQTLFRVVIPYAKSGISTAVILGTGRAIGETMAVLMVTGNSTHVNYSFLQPTRTIPATIAAELGDTSFGGVHYNALFALAIVLFLFTIIINLSVEVIKNRNKEVNQRG